MCFLIPRDIAKTWGTMAVYHQHKYFVINLSSYLPENNHTLKFKYFVTLAVFFLNLGSYSRHIEDSLYLNLAELKCVHFQSGKTIYKSPDSFNKDSTSHTCRKLISKMNRLCCNPIMLLLQYIFSDMLLTVLYLPFQTDRLVD